MRGDLTFTTILYPFPRNVSPDDEIAYKIDSEWEHEGQMHHPDVVIYLS